MNNSSDKTPLDLSQLFPFQLDEFQHQAIAALNAGSSVVVCAPTGSGKTLIGEYSIYRALARGQRVFYTTPLKALSNQKLRDFRDRFGAEQVGLLTGDVSINRDAPVLVMTTEIFRNMLYGTPIGETGTSLQGVEAVILDECHYMNDRQRGTVWEESIIYCPSDIQLVALSATIANSDQLTDWIQHVHGPTELIYSNFRPVPLDFHYCSPKGLFPLLDSAGAKLNPRLKQRVGRTRNGNRRGPRQEGPNLGYVLSRLRKWDMLPAIYFIFSRKGCDQAVSEMSQLSLVTPAEAAQLKQQIDAFVKRNPEAARAGQLEPLYQGVAAHHAGLLPAWKELVEELFQQGLIKVVFATETLAAGINMPARTTVISSLSKRTDLGHRLLTPSEFLQMAGRAGRRGMDTLGHVVTVQTPFEGAKEAAYLVTVGADPLVSQFTPSYGMVLNLLQTHTLEQAKELVERSFGQYLATLYLKPQRDAIAALEAELNQLQGNVTDIDWSLVTEYEKLKGRLREERRLLKTLQQQADDLYSRERSLTLSLSLAGTLVSLKGAHVPMPTPLPAVLVTQATSPEHFPYWVCLGRDNHWYVVTVDDVVGLMENAPRLTIEDLSPPPELSLKPGQTRQGDGGTGAIAQQIPNMVTLPDAPPEVIAQRERVQAVEEQMQRHPIHTWGKPEKIFKQRKRILAIQEELSDRRTKLGRQSHRYWEAFLDLMEILKDFGCLDNLTPTGLGQSTAAIRGDNELWLGLSLASGELDSLQPHHLAAACAALVTEVSRPDSWTNYDVPPDVEEGLAGLRGIRRRLFQLQRRHQVAIPAWLEYEFTGLVERWALGEEWTDLCANTSLDEGDVVRVLRRTLDFLSQIPYVPYLPANLKQNAIRAAHLLNRFPVSGLID